MKCPKCGYLGFEAGDRCRNCGYDFSLSQERSEPEDLSLRSEADPLGPLADLKLGDTEAPVPAARPALSTLDLDRILGGPPAPTTDLPLFTNGAPVDERPLVTPSAPRTPLAVRRSTPETPKLRPRHAAPGDSPTLDLELPRAVTPGEMAIAARRQAAAAPEPAPAAVQPAGAVRRVAAAGVDLGILGAIHAIVIYFTLRLLQVPLEQLSTLPWAPLGSFLLLLSAGYFVVFTAVGGQTIGKMALGTRVVSAAGGAVDVPHAVLRFLGGVVTLLTFGLGYLPALFGARRALHDRLAGTDVERMLPRD
jgi:uncharacterized RDD family membrane protein YckC